MQFTDTDTCAHLSVSYEPYACEECSDVHGSWVCPCGEEFLPVSWENVAMAQGEVDALQEALVEERAVSDRLRVVVLVAVAFAVGALLK